MAAIKRPVSLAKATKPLLIKRVVASDFDAPAQRQRIGPPVSSSSSPALRSWLTSLARLLFKFKEIQEEKEEERKGGTISPHCSRDFCSTSRRKCVERSSTCGGN